MSKKRIDAVRSKMVKTNLDGMVISNLDQVRYLSGYTGTNGLLVIMPRQAYFLTDFRYGEQARKQVKGARVSVMKKGDLVACLSEFPKLNIQNCRFGIAAESLSVSAKDRLQTVLDKALLVPADSLMADLGWIKDKDELANITKAAEIGDIAFGRVLQLVKPGAKEREIAAELEYQMVMLGAEKPAFETIVASGPRSAMPHGVASSRRLKNGDLITFDFGATVNGYVSDMTRTVVLGKASARQKKIYNLVLKAHRAGIRRVRAGVKGSDVDAACRRIITKAGYGKQFGHGTGHGIGFLVHMGPSMAPNSEHVLAVGHVITVEPGIYIKGWGGVRIEDDILVTRRGGKSLNSAEKKLLEL
jgi:Xaa-Pro aminopeptidase